MSGISIAIDRGGTFTDVIAFFPGRPNLLFKLLSVDPANYSDANIEGIRRVLEHASGKKIPRDQPLDTSCVRSLKLGTTVATNALLERKGERCAFITTKGFKDSLLIGDQTRPRIFELDIQRPDVIYDTVVEIDERVTMHDYFEDPQQTYTEPDGVNLVRGVTGETIEVLRRPNVDEISAMLKTLYAAGIRSVAVCLLHSYTFPAHELVIGEIARAVGFTHVSLSHELSPMIKHVPRANLSVADAYLTPEIKKYLESFKNGLKDGVQSVAEGKTLGVKCQFMKSDGGLVELSKFSGLKAVLSGPAGGVVGIAKTCFDKQSGVPLIGLDVGGTSTDCSRFAGKYEHILETTTAGITIQSPQLDINTIAAGGGLRLFYENGLMRVGPESAGAHPGPVCYKKGGFLAITDANLVLNRLVPETFPKIFGPHENEALDVDATFAAFRKLTAQINKESGQNLSIEQVAEGFLNVANEAMARPLRTLTEARGHVLSDHRLVSFGGAGGQCCCFVAFDALGLDLVLIHKYLSVLSAYGMALADVVEEVQEPASEVLGPHSEKALSAVFDRLVDKASQNLVEQGIESQNIVIERYLNMKYKGTESLLMTPADLDLVSDYVNAFTALHKAEFGFAFEDKAIVVDDVRVRAIGKTFEGDEVHIDSEVEKIDKHGGKQPGKPLLTRDVYFKGKFHPTPIFDLETLPPGTVVAGPCIVVNGTQTNVVPPTAELVVLESHLFIRNTKTGPKKTISKDVILPIMLSIFGHRFVDIAEQMGYLLQKTAVLTNVKERLDFSCALFDADANLIASAPHIPVHLGSMSTFVKYQANLWKGKLKPGDVLVGNHPICGTHLPDITVLTPVFHENQIVFYLASRAHHSDIGSILPGSMPPNSRELWQEGAVIFSELLIKDGVFQEDRMVQLLLEEPAKYPGCSGTRKLSDNLSDLQAQAAANQKGVGLLSQLVDEFGLDVVVAYMEAIQANAANTVEKLLGRVIQEKGGELEAEDFMDDGSRIKLKVSISGDGKKAKLDFSGTSPEMYSNMNAPKAITYLATIYCLRCLVNEDIPLNEGFLRPLEIVIPEGSFLLPSEGAAVVAGNVLTSQRITDTIFKAFGAMADSQGCTNNLTFGIGGKEEGAHVEGFGYYETIAGGAGAGPTWDGVSGVHVNMTNTKMTDVEVFEKRYPVLLHEFSIRKGSGGKGKYHGGDGVVRDIEFKIPLKALILSERRVNAPHGVEGGEDGARGLNLWIRQIFKNEKVVERRTINIGGKSTVEVSAGDHIVINTPGGGGFGRFEERIKQDLKEDRSKSIGGANLGAGSVHKRMETQNTN